MPAAYIDDCRLLRALACVLELPAVASTTAFTYLHRIRLCQHDVQITGQELVTACIYVAAKVEEVNVSANQLINSARILSHPSQQHLLQSLAPLPAQLLPQQQLPPQHSSQQQQQQQQQQAAPAPPNPNTAASNRDQHQQSSTAAAAVGESLPSAAVVVVGDEYYQAKDALFTAEQIVLRLMNFKLEGSQPHKHLLNLCKLLCVSQVVAAAAVCLLNDAVAYTNLCVTVDAAVLAAAVLECCLESLCRTEGSIQQQQQQGAQEIDFPGGFRHGMHPHSDRQYSTQGAAANSRLFHQLPDVQQGQQNQHQQQEMGDQLRHSASSEQRPQQQQAQHRSRALEAEHNRGSLAHQSQEQQQRRHHGQSSSSSRSVPDAALDGSWVGFVGLHTGQVAELAQQLKQLLPQPQ